MITVFNKQFDQINLADIQYLIDNNIQETWDLEYKCDAWTDPDKGSDENTREMLRDISGMANAQGGYFILGLNEVDGGSLELKEIENTEMRKDEIFSSCLSNLHPRIPNLDIRDIEIDKDKKILIIKVPKSHFVHMITFKGLNQFWIRHDRQKQPMTMNELRDGFIRVYNSANDLKQLLKEKRDELIEECNGRACLALNAIPLRLMDDLFDISNQSVRDSLQNNAGDRIGGHNFNNTYYNNSKPSIDGLSLLLDNKYLRLSRNGYFGAVVIGTEDDPGLFYKNIENIPYIRNIALVEYVYSFCNKLKQITKEIGYNGPFQISLHLFNVNNHKLKQYKVSAINRNSNKWNKDNLEISPIVFEFVDSKKIAKTLCDRLWQAFGYENEPFFNDSTGDFIFE